MLDELAEDSVWVLGNSMGGQLALDVALRAPDRVTGLILLGARNQRPRRSRRWTPTPSGWPT